MPPAHLWLVTPRWHGERRADGGGTELEDDPAVTSRGTERKGRGGSRAIWCLLGDLLSAWPGTPGQGGVTLRGGGGAETPMKGPEVGAEGPAPPAPAVREPLLMPALFWGRWAVKGRRRSRRRPA